MDVKEAIKRMKKNGFKYTAKREKILTIFAEEKRYLTAKDVLEYVQTDYPNMSFDTIYRNLSLFTELNILEETELEGEKRFRFTCSKDDHHHHVICLSCGRTKHIESCPMDSIESNFPDFQIYGHKFEIYGKCESCLTS